MRIHISLNVSDLDASVAFYERLFGAPVTKRRPDYANFRLDVPPVHLALQPTRAQAHPTAPTATSAHSHFGVELPDAATFTAWQSRLHGSGVDLVDEQNATCCYATADKTWATDPDGNSWEVWVRTGEAERLAPAQGGCCQAA